jgi:hypothetical protein
MTEELIHEIMHAIETTRLLTHVPGQGFGLNDEPYFEKEPVSELGFSFEHAVGIPQCSRYKQAQY